MYLSFASFFLLRNTLLTFKYDNFETEVNLYTNLVTYLQRPIKLGIIH